MTDATGGSKATEATGASYTPVCVYVMCRLPSVGYYPLGERGIWPLCGQHSRQECHFEDVDMRRFVRYEGVKDA